MWLVSEEDVLESEVNDYDFTYPGARHNIYSILSMIKGLNHGNESWTSVSFLIHAGQIVMHLN